MSPDNHFWDDRKVGLVDLHSHVGSSVRASVLWSLAHQQGIKLPTKDYWEFVKLVTIQQQHSHLNDYAVNFDLPELIQSSPLAIERSIYEIIGGAYRSSNIVLQEPRFNPMKRNHGGEQDLDHIITGAIRGLERSLLEYPYIKGGLILMLDRIFSLEKNRIIVDKAVQYSREKAIVGIDIAGPRLTDDHNYSQYGPMLAKAREAGLGITIHVGEEGQSTKEMWDVIEIIKPDRIGHGLIAHTDKNLMKKIVENKIVLEICPTSNLNTGSIKSIEEMKIILRTFLDNGVSFCINTDGPELNCTRIKQEMQFLYDNKIMSEPELLKANQIGFEASFIKED